MNSKPILQFQKIFANSKKVRDFGNGSQLRKCSRTWKTFIKNIIASMSFQKMCMDLKNTHEYESCS